MLVWGVDVLGQYGGPWPHPDIQDEQEGQKVPLELRRDDCEDFRRIEDFGGHDSHNQDKVENPSAEPGNKLKDHFLNVRRATMPTRTIAATPSQSNQSPEATPTAIGANTAPASPTGRAGLLTE